MRLHYCHNAQDFRCLARKNLPSPIFHYLVGGSDDEWSLGNNASAFSRYELLPRALRDVSQIDLSTTILGRKMALPLLLSPTGASQILHHHKELAVARAAAAAGLMYSLSTVGSTSLEDVSAHTNGPKMFQLYVFKDRGLTKELIARAKAAGYDALCLTVDTVVGGNRERDLLTGMSLPPRFTPASLLSIIAHPKWLFNFRRSGGVSMPNIDDWVKASAESAGGGAAAFIDAQFDRKLTWDGAAWIAREWAKDGDKPFMIKGIISPDDAIRARDIGAKAVMISNHGGRQLDGVPAPIDMVAPMRDLVGDTLELIVDGGVRRGTDILKALALGADACSIGRPYLYGLAAGGEAGVARVLSIFRDEFERGMTLLGCNSVSQIGPEFVQRHAP